MHYENRLESKKALIERQGNLYRFSRKRLIIKEQVQKMTINDKTLTL